MRRQSGRDYLLFHSPVGWIGLVEGEGGLLEIILGPRREEVFGRLRENHPEAVSSGGEPGSLLRLAATQIREYLEGRRFRFELPLDLRGIPPFAAAVLECLARVPYGETVTYGRLATLAGRPKAARAAGRTMATNPFPLVIPCHRVVGADGSMTGYSGGDGIATKRWLLDLERRFRKNAEGR